MSFLLIESSTKTGLRCSGSTLEGSVLFIECRCCHWQLLDQHGQVLLLDDQKNLFKHATGPRSCSIIDAALASSAPLNACPQVHRKNMRRRLEPSPLFVALKSEKTLPKSEKTLRLSKKKHWPNFQTEGAHSKQRFGRMQKQPITGEDEKVSEKPKLDI